MVYVYGMRELPSKSRVQEFMAALQAQDALAYQIPPLVLELTPALTPVLAGELDRVCASAARAWPALVGHEGGFVGHLATKVPPYQDQMADRANPMSSGGGSDGGGATDGDGFWHHVVAWLGKVHADDLYLAYCCSTGDRAAIAAFDARHGGDIAAALRRVRTDRDLRDDARQILYDRLFVGTSGHGAKIANYGARGPLRLWLRVTVVRIGLELVDSHGREVQADDDELLALPAAADDPEIGYLKQLYRKEFEEAFVAAVATLDRGQRTLLMQYHVDGLTIDQLGALYRVHRVTAARRVARAREALVKATRRQVERRLELSQQGFERMMQTIWSNLDISVYRILGATPTAETGSAGSSGT